MKRFDGYVLVSDFDGTLINQQGKISDENIEAIQTFVALGGLFCGATGRTQLSIEPYKQVLPIVAPWILFNGAVVYDFEQQAFLHIESCSHEPLIPLVNTIMNQFPTLNTQICTAQMLYLVNPTAEDDQMVVFEDQPHERCNLADIKEPLIKLMFQGPRELLVAVETVLAENLPLDTYRFFYSGENYLEIMENKVSKGSGLKALRLHLGETAKHVCAIGDYYNDVEMLEWADISATPENAPEDIKKFATVVVNHHDDHALKDFIEWLDENR